MEIGNAFKDQTKLFKIEVHFFDQDQGNFHISVILLNINFLGSSIFFEIKILIF